MSKLAQMFLT